MPQAYSNPKRADDPHALPDVEYFEAPHARRCEGCGMLDIDGDYIDRCDCPEGDEDVFSWEKHAGWYFWYCIPGCMPDSDPDGPYATKAECIEAFTNENVPTEDDES